MVVWSIRFCDPVPFLHTNRKIQYSQNVLQAKIAEYVPATLRYIQACILLFNMAMKAKLYELLDEECSIIMSTVIYQRLSRGQDCLLQSITPSVWTAYPPA